MADGRAKKFDLMKENQWKTFLVEAPVQCSVEFQNQIKLLPSDTDVLQSPCKYLQCAAAQKIL